MFGTGARRLCNYTAHYLVLVALDACQLHATRSDSTDYAHNGRLPHQKASKDHNEASLGYALKKRPFIRDVHLQILQSTPASVCFSIRVPATHQWLLTKQDDTAFTPSSFHNIF
ncbi:hypothetical protein LY78DRAFT_141470 [Colletotrichum sublineola]|nr:hypothetical protein LY78DRAFT_141470 [Colletotrichum sublineola]